MSETTIVQPNSRAVIDAFNSWDLANTPAINGSSRWSPPAGEYELLLTDIAFDPQGLKWKDKDSGADMSAPTVQCRWQVLSGEFATKDFQDDKYILGNREPASEGGRKAQIAERGRLRGILEVVTGQQVVQGGLPTALAAAQKIVSDSKGFPLRGSVYRKKKANSSYDYVNVTAIEALPVS